MIIRKLEKEKISRTQKVKQYVPNYEKKEHNEKETQTVLVRIIRDKIGSVQREISRTSRFNKKSRKNLRIPWNLPSLS